MSVIHILTILFCVVPLIWIVLIGKNNNNKINKRFRDAIKRENLSFSLKEQWSNNFIGVDTSKNWLVFLKLNSEESSIQKIDLAEVESCEIKIKSREFIKDKQKETVLELLDLELSFYNEGESIVLNFYDSNGDFSENYELDRAKKWQNLIEQIMLNKSFHKRAA